VPAVAHTPRVRANPSVITTHAPAPARQVNLGSAARRPGGAVREAPRAVVLPFWAGGRAVETAVPYEQSSSASLAHQKKTNPNSVAKISPFGFFFFLCISTCGWLLIESMGELLELFVCWCQVERGIDLVYGGGSIGLMGLVSHAVHDGGRHVIG
jgi:hypothetical protein